MRIHFYLTINFPDETIHQELKLNSLTDLDDFIATEFPDATSFVIVYSKSKTETER